jgi:mannose-6-phosphate isomerase
MDAIIPLRGVVKNYDWGGHQFIASLLAIDNPDKKPLAEYWMGVHPQGMTMASTAKGEWLPLTDLTPQLSFLFKVLDVRTMLSIQVHPTKAAAAIEYERENALGVALDSPQRNYKDANHKPELMVALSPFWLLHGFQESTRLQATLTRATSLQFLLPVFEQGGYEALYRYVMEMPQRQVDASLRTHIDAIVPLYHQNKLSKDDPDYWAARAALAFSNEGAIDRGIFSIYFFNLVRLSPGEAIFQDAGVPHAYLEGQNVEIMANSDNVLRGGLTTKHIDVQELIKHIRFEPIIPAILHPSGHEGLLDAPVEDFCLRQVAMSAGTTQTLVTDTPLVMLCVRGSVEAMAGDRVVLIKQGQPAALLMPGATVSVRAVADALLFCATAGIHSR